MIDPLRWYPRWWRDRYGDELAAILDAHAPAGRARLDLIRGALDAWLRGDPVAGSRARSPSGPAGHRPSEPGATVAVLAGAAWTITAVASLASPTPLDWPGYRADTLPLAVAGALLVTIATVVLLRRGWLAAGLGLELVVLVVPVAGLAWAMALSGPFLGVPYGALTGAVQCVAGIALAIAGLALLRADRTALGLAPLVAGAAFVVPSPAGWLVAGAVWTAVGVWLRWLAAPPDGGGGWIAEPPR